MGRRAANMGGPTDVFSAASRVSRQLSRIPGGRRSCEMEELLESGDGSGIIPCRSRRSRHQRTGRSSRSCKRWRAKRATWSARDVPSTGGFGKRGGTGRVWAGRGRDPARDGRPARRGLTRGTLWVYGLGLGPKVFNVQCSGFACPDGAGRSGSGLGDLLKDLALWCSEEEQSRQKEGRRPALNTHPRTDKPPPPSHPGERSVRRSPSHEVAQHHPPLPFDDASSAVAGSPPCMHVLASLRAGETCQGEPVGGWARGWQPIHQIR